MIWTNRFPVSYLEGLEDLIQDPHKMLDEVNGRRFQVRRYLDTGETLDCRQPERCKHCFIEPFCTSTDRFIAMQNQEDFEVWITDPEQHKVPAQLPYGCTRTGLHVTKPSAVQDITVSGDLEITCDSSGTLPELNRDIRWIADSPEQLEEWLPTLSSFYSLEIWLNKRTAVWMLDNRQVIIDKLEQIRLHQPTFEKMKETVDDVVNPANFFEQLNLPIKTSGLPACIARSMLYLLNL